MNESTPQPAVTIVGAGLAGTLLAILLARRQVPVLLVERRGDPRLEPGDSGRSINLALAARGIAALKAAGVFATVEPLLIPMPGRQLHARGSSTFVPYGQGEHEAIHSVSRQALNRLLLDELAQLPGVVIGFNQECLGADFDAQVLRMRDAVSGQAWRLPLDRVVAADGAGSPLRHSLADHLGIEVTEDLLAHGYKELTLPPDAGGQPQFAPNALHIWPRGDFMLIALPNTDGSFTLTLFLPLEGPNSFAGLDNEAAVLRFFEEHFPDVIELVPELPQEFASHPVGHMGTVRCPQWTAAGRLVLIGDAAHAIVPFHGQGMNCAFEDCVVLADLAAGHSWAEACSLFSVARKPDADAIATMAIENYLEMRDTVREPRFQLQKALSLELERRFPRRFVPRYSMVMFHHEIPYRLAYERGAIQAQILDELTRDASNMETVDFARAGDLIMERLPELVP